MLFVLTDLQHKIADFNIELEVLLHSIRSSNNILCGDLNIDLFDLTAAGNQFVDMMKSFFHISHVYPYLRESPLLLAL